ncbi:hypothetical protein X975_00915, partial [Stegodyphus mimosarum]
MFGPFKIKENDGSYQELELIMRKLSFVNSIITESKRIGIWTYGQPTGKIKFEAG